MLEIFNVILIVIILVTIYYLIENNKDNKKEINYSIPLNIPQAKETIERFEDKDTKYINFDYDTKPIEQEVIKEQKEGVYLNTWYPNTWIERIDENGNPIYNSRENITKEPKDSTKIILDYMPESSKSYEFNKNKPEDNDGKTIKEIYDNSMVDYKKLVPIKNKISDETSDIVMPGGSNLTYFTPDTWTYDQENPENGGLIYNNVYGDDPMSNNASVF